MRKSILVLCLVVALSSFATWQLLVKPFYFGSNAPDSLSDSANKEQDILPQVLAWNNEKNIPTQKFRTGHVTPGTLQNYFQKTEDGYCIKLPSSTIVPTPAVVTVCYM